jgi:hypothetical protein
MKLGEVVKRGASDYKCECKKRLKLHRLAETVPRVAERSVGAAGTVAARHNKVKANARVNIMVVTRSLIVDEYS